MSESNHLHICILSRLVVQQENGGGMDLFAEMLRRGLAERGHRVTTITTPHPRNMPRESDVWGETFFVGTGAPGRYSRDWWKSSLSALLQLHAHDPIDIVAGHGKAIYRYLGMRRHLPEIERIPAVVITQNTIIQDFRGQFGQLRRHPFKFAKWLPHAITLFLDDRRRLPLADAITALTNDHAQTLKRWFSLDPSRLSVIPNGVDTAPFIAAATLRKSVRQHLGVGDGVSVLLVLARLSPDKGHRFLLEALARPELQSYGSNIRLVLAGEGHGRNDLVSQVQALKLQDTVKFLGRVPRDDVPGLLAAADVVVLPSVAEGMPISLLEAMVCGRPVIASNIPAIASFIEDGVTGRLTPVAHPDALARALVELLDDRAYAAALGERARAYAIERYDQHAVVTEFERMFQRTVGASTWQAVNP